jgi:hypothetical protein
MTHTRRRHTLALCGLALVWCSACSSSSGSTDSFQDKYQQTWAKSYSSTTCTDWNSAMTTQQQFVAAADMLTGARNKDHSTGVPPNLLVRNFQADITQACSVQGTADSLKLTEVGVSIYLLGDDTYKP